MTDGSISCHVLAARYLLLGQESLIGLRNGPSRVILVMYGRYFVIYGVEFALPSSASSKPCLKPSKVLASCPPLACPNIPAI